MYLKNYKFMKEVFVYKLGFTIYNWKMEKSALPWPQLGVKNCLRFPLMQIIQSSARRMNGA
jgi:hypothetical protein